LEVVLEPVQPKQSSELETSYLKTQSDLRPNLETLLSSAIGDTLREFLGVGRRDKLYHDLRARYDITREELPYRSETLYHAIEADFDIIGANTLGPTIARKFYAKLGLPFHEHDAYTLNDYVEAAKKQIAKR